MIELNAEAIYRDFAARVIDRVGRRDVRLVGIHTGGVWLAQRLRAELKIEHPVGVLDVSFYRDDFAQGGLAPDVRPSRIPFEVAGRDLLLIDRGGRELPIAAQVVGRTIELPPDVGVALTRDDDLGFHLTLEQSQNDD